MSKTNYEIPYSPITEVQGTPSPLTLPWLQWTGNMGTAMNTIQTASSNMTPLNPSTATLNDMVTAWEALRVALKGLV